MEQTFMPRLKHAWNALRGREEPDYRYVGTETSVRPDRPRLTRGNEQSIITAIYNRISIDVAALPIQHVRLDEEGRYKETIDSGLNNCLTVEANVDQTGRAFIQDAVLSMLDEGVVALVPVDTSRNPMLTESYDVLTLRTGKIVKWAPKHVTVKVYDENDGNKKEVTLPKSMVAIVENPFYSVMNSPNSTMQRLVRKLNILDAIDEQSGSGKMDLIIQLPYTLKSHLRQAQAEERRRDIEDQLRNSKYGIAYIDGTEHITQLNRPAENNLMSQIEYLTSMLYSQLGITQAIMDGTAEEVVRLNYTNSTIEPIVSAIVDEMKRTFLSKTARSQMQSIMFFSDPFRLVSMDKLSEIADRFTRNEILSSNEIRQIIGRKPSGDPRADQLLNKNLNHPDEKQQMAKKKTADEEEKGTNPNTEEEIQNE